jgi:hypothetical protein
MFRMEDTVIKQMYVLCCLLTFVEWAIFVITDEYFVLPSQWMAMNQNKMDQIHFTLSFKFELNWTPLDFIVQTKEISVLYSVFLLSEEISTFPGGLQCFLFGVFV